MKACVDCRWCAPKMSCDSRRNQLYFSRCTHPDAAPKNYTADELVAGDFDRSESRPYCSTQRSYQRHPWLIRVLAETPIVCGREGRLWQAKDAP